MFFKYIGIISIRVIENRFYWMYIYMFIPVWVEYVYHFTSNQYFSSLSGQDSALIRAM